jgi:hypothetical protein
VINKNGMTHTPRWTLDFFLNVGSGLELNHMEMGKFELPWGIFFHLGDGLAVGASTGATGVEGPCL